MKMMEDHSPPASEDRWEMPRFMSCLPILAASSSRCSCFELRRLLLLLLLPAARGSPEVVGRVGTDDEEADVEECCGRREDCDVLECGTSAE